MRIPKLRLIAALLSAVLIFSTSCTSSKQVPAATDGEDPAKVQTSTIADSEQSDTLAPDETVNVLNEFNKPATDSNSYGKNSESDTDPVAPTPTQVTMVFNKVLVDDDNCKIVVVNKSVDKYGDAGYTLLVYNRQPRLTQTGILNYIYLNPLLWSWTVDGVEMTPKVTGNVYAVGPMRLFLYFDDLNAVEQLVNVKGTLQVFDANDWWDPIATYEIEV